MRFHELNAFYRKRIYTRQPSDSFTAPKCKAWCQLLIWWEGAASLGDMNSRFGVSSHSFPTSVGRREKDRAAGESLRASIRRQDCSRRRTTEPSCVRFTAMEPISPDRLPRSRPRRLLPTKHPLRRSTRHPSFPCLADGAPLCGSASDLALPRGRATNERLPYTIDAPLVP
jgi:hypothetical protein